MTKKTDCETLLKEKSRDGVISCSAALRAAGELTMSPREIGEILDTLEIKIVECQLGCFGTEKEHKKR